MATASSPHSVNESVRVLQRAIGVHHVDVAEPFRGAVCVGEEPQSIRREFRGPRCRGRGFYDYPRAASL